MKSLGVNLAWPSVSGLCFLLQWLHTHSGFPFLVTKVCMLPVDILIGPNSEKMRACLFQHRNKSLKSVFHLLCLNYVPVPKPKTICQDTAILWLGMSKLPCALGLWGGEGGVPKEAPICVPKSLGMYNKPLQRNVIPFVCCQNYLLYCWGNHLKVCDGSKE